MHKTEQLLLFTAVVLGTISIIIDSFLSKLAYASIILIGVTFMAIKDRKTKKIGFWIILIIISLVLLGYIISQNIN